jgi:hypothetical protein
LVTTAAWWLVKNRSAGAEGAEEAGEVQPLDPSTAAEATATGIAAMTARRRGPPLAERSELAEPVIVATRQSLGMHDHSTE